MPPQEQIEIQQQHLNACRRSLMAYTQQQARYGRDEVPSYILEGALKFWIDGKVIVVKGGDVLTIPPHMPHKAEALEDTVDLDVFNPPREDWLNKTDKYLRSGSK